MCMLLSGHLPSRHTCEGSCAVRSANAHVRNAMPGVVLRMLHLLSPSHPHMERQSA